MPEMHHTSIAKVKYPAKSPIVGVTCNHPRPRKRRNRHFRQCGYYTLSECRNGGLVSARNWLKRVYPIHKKIIAKRGKWTRARTAGFFGYSERQVSRLWNGSQRTFANIRRGTYGYRASSSRPHGARTWVAKRLHWCRVIASELPTLTNRRMIEIRKGQYRSLIRELERYGGAIIRGDGLDKWTAIIRSSYLWIDRLNGQLPR